ncbi:F-box/RNI-like superfamily protein [Artemisia annua]|uniref:F-box/RNI-like superfamily protein n=1 Tax=Artemisia annua TaxID=35608 RepID=A0A2U1MZY7_ARTAN|nr:F-box/RNI-like superfamily protein [Artemisia annua]
MDTLPEPILFDILSRLDSADVTRLRLTSNTFETLYPELRSINLQCTFKWFLHSSARVSNSSNSSQTVTPFKTVVINLISDLRVVESVRIGITNTLRYLPDGYFDEKEDDLHLTDVDFIMEWLPRVSETLKSLSITDFFIQSVRRRTNVLFLISVYCQNLVDLELKYAWLFTPTLNPMPMLTTLTLEQVRFSDKLLNELNECFPNLQVLNLIDISGLVYPIIRLLNLKSFHFAVNSWLALTIVTPNLLFLKLECSRTGKLFVEAPALSEFHLTLDKAGTFSIKMFENLNTLVLESLHLDFILSVFPVTYSVENLTLESREWTNGAIGESVYDLGKVFSIFPNTSSLCIKSRDFSELDPSFNLIGLKTLCVYLAVVDPIVIFSSIASVMDECICLSEVSVVIKHDSAGDAYQSFIAKCMAYWPLMKWKWGTWSEGREDTWLSF